MIKFNYLTFQTEETKKYALIALINSNEYAMRSLIVRRRRALVGEVSCGGGGGGRRVSLKCVVVVATVYLLRDIFDNKLFVTHQTRYTSCFLYRMLINNRQNQRDTG